MEFGPKTWAQVAGQPPKHCATPKPAARGTMPAAQSLPAMTHPAPRPTPVLAAASTAAQSPGRHTHSQPSNIFAGNAVCKRSDSDQSWDRPSMEDCLPGDVLEAILGFLDRETLCTARLVSRTFCAMASSHVCSLTFRKTFQAVSCRRFPRLSRVTVDHCAKWGKLAQLDPSLRDIITTLDIRATTPEECQVFVSETLSQIALMPKLRELDVSLWHLDGETGQQAGEVDVGALAGELCRCTNLESIRLTAPEFNFSRAMTIASTTSLKELRIIPTLRPRRWDVWDRSPDTSWLRQATGLRNLRALSIVTPSDALPLIGNLTGLTALSWSIYDVRSSAYSIAPLTRLTKLKSVGLMDTHLDSNGMSESNADIACSLGFGSLANLELQASDSCGKFLTRQTALTRLSLDGKLCNLRNMGALRLELLQSLWLGNLVSVDDEGLSFLRKATSLTHLSISTGLSMDVAHQPPDLRLSQALAGLTQLRSLMVHPSTAYPEFLDYPLVLRALTGLTQLKITCTRLDKERLRALLTLTGLRVLDLILTGLPNDMVPELGLLTNLKKLSMLLCGVTTLAPVTNVVKPLRHARGWPPMDAIHE